MLTMQDLISRRANRYRKRCERWIIRAWKFYFLALLLSAIYGISTYQTVDAEMIEQTATTTGAYVPPKVTSVERAIIETITETATEEISTEIITETTTEITTKTERITVEPTTVVNYDDNELYLLAQVIDAEAGDECSDEHKRWVGQVVLNRVSHDKFPNTIFDVVYQEGQYSSVINGELGTPSERSLDAAKWLLGGNSVNNDVIWQAEFPQGDTTVKTFQTKYSTTYFCK